MIALFGRNDYSVLGIAAILDSEKIPYRRVERLDAGAGELLLTTGAELSAAEAAAISSRRALVLNGGAECARTMFGAREATDYTGCCSIALDAPIWSSGLADVAGRFGTSALRIPLAPMCRTAAIAAGTTLASFDRSPIPGSAAGPAIVQREECVWSAVDLGAAFAHLLGESYWPEAARGDLSSGLRQRGRRYAESAYYAAPDAVRRWIQRRAYAAAEARLQARAGVASEYPIDGAGWLLIALVKRLILLAAGVCVRLERWPAPYQAAATLTHDVEPRSYAYGAGLERLLHTVEANGHAPAAFGLVAGASARFLTAAMGQRLATHEVFCHGLEHRGEPVHGRARVARRLQTARQGLERQLRRPLCGYRSPRLDRSPDLAWALDRSGFEYDSSYPDVDRENLAHFGRGVRVNLPFRPIIEGAAGSVRFSRCLELPLTAPDCIQPLFAGQDVATLRASVAAKAAFVCASGGLYVALVHAGVFGDRDAEVRGDHYAFVRRQLEQPGFWLAGIGQIAEWWRGREAVRVAVQEQTITISNTADRPITGVRVAVERLVEGAVETVRIPLPPLAAGGAVMLRLDDGAYISEAAPYTSTGAASGRAGAQVVGA